MRRISHRKPAAVLATGSGLFLVAESLVEHTTYSLVLVLLAALLMFVGSFGLLYHLVARTTATSQSG